MYITKILETTIPSSGTTATFTDSEIPNSLIRVFSTNNNLYPQSIALSGNTLTVTYEAVTSALGVAVELVKGDIEVVDSLTSTATNKALSAYQGKILYDALNNIEIPEDITDLSDIEITDIEDGQVLAWNAELQKFVNTDQSGGGGGNDYSTDEQVIGTWIDGSTLYRKSFVFSSSLTVSHETFTDTGFSIQNLSKIIFGYLYRVANTGYISGDFNITNTNHIGARVLSNYDLSFGSDSVLTVEYTKITN